MLTKTYYTVSIYYGGDGPVQECFRSKADAQEFYSTHDCVNPPEKFYADTLAKIDWAESRISDFGASKA